MDKFEQQIKAALDTEFGRRASGKIEANLADGAASYSGSLKVKSVFSEEKVKEAFEYFDEQNIDFSGLLSSLRTRSSTGERGAVFNLVILLNKGKVSFNYDCEGDEFSSIEDIPKSSFSTIPLFVYRKSFSRELIQATDVRDMTIGQSEFVQALMKAGKTVPENHRLLYSLSDLIGDVNNGGFNQYFQRSVTWDNAQIEREPLYVDVDAALTLIDMMEVRDIFREALAIYAHLYNRVDVARTALGIVEIEKQDTHDLDSRYYDSLSDLENKFGTYIKTNPDLFFYEKIT